MDHPDKLVNYPGTIQQLASELSNLRYDVLVEFLQCLADEMYEQYVSDSKKGRKKLANSLLDCYSDLTHTAVDVKKAWEISKPFMK
jgi:hypothetical protein